MTAQPVMAFEELAQFLASLSPRRVLAFKTSKKSQERVSYLLDKNAEQGLSAEENREMEQYMLIEHLVQLAKAKALLRVAEK
jgi:SpoU rRNA methylase family enzyme